MTPELNDLCVAAAHAVGGGVLAVDVLEDPNSAATWSTKSTTPWNSIPWRPMTGVDVAGLIVDYAIAVAAGGSRRSFR